MDPSGQHSNHLPPSLQHALWDYDLGDGLGWVYCSCRRGHFVCPGARARGHLWDVQDDVGGTNIGDGVLFHVAVRWADCLMSNGGKCYRSCVNHGWRW